MNNKKSQEELDGKALENAWQAEYWFSEKFHEDGGCSATPEQVFKAGWEHALEHARSESESRIEEMKEDLRAVLIHMRNYADTEGHDGNVRRCDEIKKRWGIE